MQLINLLVRSSKNYEEMIFTTASSESIVVFLTMKTMNWTLLHYQRNYRTTFSKLPEKKNKYSGIFIVEKARELTSKFVEQ